MVCLVLYTTTFTYSGKFGFEKFNIIGILDYAINSYATPSVTKFNLAVAASERASEEITEN